MSFVAVGTWLATNWVSVALFVVSTVMQQQAAADARDRQRKAQEEADARADAAKGTSIVVEGEITPLRVLYGRNLIGGNRVYHKTYNTYVHADVGAGGVAFNRNLASSISGSKHEFLITQQALCIGGINSCVNVDIDQKKIDGEYVNELNEVVIDPKMVPSHVPAAGYYSDYSEGNSSVWVETAPAYDTTVLAPGITKIDPYSYGIRVHVYPDGGAADPLMTANDASRATATFTNTAFATCVYRYNRDEPQFSGVPTAQFYVEGMKIYSITPALELSATKTYSNNSALCLLDYLMSPLYGRGLSINDIDMESFYLASLVCDRVVRTKLPREGGFWSKKDAQHDARLYECNIGLDTAKELRSNIELLLSTMGSVDLVWSGGKYKLQLRYPVVYGTVDAEYSKIVQYNNSLFKSLIQGANTNIPQVGPYWEDAIDAYITDDDIIRDGETSVSWPNAGTRLNFVTVRYLNESKDFKEDTVTWPPKRSVPGEPIKDRGQWYQYFEYTLDDGVLYNGVYYRRLVGGNAVDSTTPDLAPALWKVVVYDTVDRGVWNPITTYAENDKVSDGNVVYRRLAGGSAVSSVPPGQDVALWSIMIYDTFSFQDSHIPLESEVFADGVTSYYNALARAEQTVRESRVAVTYAVNVDHNFIQLEPGDFLKVDSDVLKIPNELVKVTEVKPDDKGVIKLSCVKFDAAALAWNVKDTELTPVRNLYSNSIEQANDLAFSFSSDTSLGTLTWSAANDIRVTRYAVMYSVGEVDEDTVWHKISSTDKFIAEIPFVSLSNINLAVISVGPNDQLAPRENWPILNIVVTNSFVVSNLALTATSFGLALSWDDVIDAKKGSYEIREGGTNWDNATFVGATSASHFDLNSPRPVGDFTYRVRYTNRFGLVATNSIEKTFTIVAPDRPSLLLISGQILTWPAVTKSTLGYPIAGYEVRVANQTAGSWGTATEIGTGVITESPYTLPVTLSGQKTILIKTVDVFGNESVDSTNIYTDVGDYSPSNILETFPFDPIFLGTKTDCTVVSNQLIANGTDVLYGDDADNFYLGNATAFYDASMYTGLSYITDDITVTQVLAGSYGSLETLISGDNVIIQYTFVGYGAFYEADGDAFYQDDSSQFYGTNDTVEGPFEYMGPFKVKLGGYRFTVTTSIGLNQGIITTFRFNVDAPDMTEIIPDLTIAATPTAIPYTKVFTVIKAVIAQLQANVSGAVTVEVDKTVNLAPTIKAYNSGHTAVSGASADIQIKGY